MISARPLVAAALLTSTWLIAQDTPPTKSRVLENSNLASTSQSRPLAIDLLGSTRANVPLLSFEPIEQPMFGQEQISETKVLNAQDVGPFAIPPGAFADTYCLKIRSYQMARDSKNSDSTHLVGYSTCLPASKYRLRTAVRSSQPALSH